MSGGEGARRLGQWGEEQVANRLLQQGWRIVGRNFRCRLGELDIIAENGIYLAFVEVKLRKTAAYGSAAAFVDWHKQQRLRTAAELYLAGRPTGLQPRFDVIEIYAPQGTDTENPGIFHLENAF